MSKRRRRRKRRFRVTTKGYLVLIGFALVVALGVFLCVAFSVYRKEMQANDASKATPGADSAVSSSPDAEASPTPAPTLTPGPTPALASTGSRLPTAEEEAGAVDGIIRTSNIVLRKGAGKAFEVIHKYNVGEYVKVFAEENGYAFVQILSDSRYGFLSSEFVTKFGPLPSDASATPVPAAPAGTVMGLVNVDEVKLRSVPSTEKNTPISMCKNGALLWVHFQTGEFYYVDVAATGERGYVFAEYVMAAAPAPTGTPVP